MAIFRVILNSLVAVCSQFYRQWLPVETQHQLSPMTRRHLSQVYLLISLFFGVSTFGFCLSALDFASPTLGSYLGYYVWYIGRSVALVGMLYNIGSFYMAGPRQQIKRLHRLLIGGFFMGASVIPWLGSWLNIDPRLIIVTFAALSRMFWMASKRADQIDLLYIGETCRSNLLTYLSVLLWTIVLWDKSIPLLKMVYALAWFIVYVGIYSWVLVQKIEDGNLEHEMHAITIFSDSPFVVNYILVLMYKDLFILGSQGLELLGAYLMPFAELIEQDYYRGEEDL